MKGVGEMKTRQLKKLKAKLAREKAEALRDARWGDRVCGKIVDKIWREK